MASSEVLKVVMSEKSSNNPRLGDGVSRRGDATEEILRNHRPPGQLIWS